MFLILHLPQLSNIGAIIEDLRSIREKIFRSEKTTKSGRRYLDLAAFVAEINAEEEKAVAVVPRRNGTLFHPFEISQTHVPGGSLKNLRLGEEVVVQLFLRPGFYEIPVERLTPEEIKNRPRTWELDESKEIVLAPWCLGDEEAEKWPARPEIIDFVRRQSWQYGFNARIISLQERQEWVAGANENIQRWSANIVKAREAIIKIQQNIALNSAKEREARSRGNVEWADRFQQWIQEGQQKIRDIEVSIRTWQEKISSVQRQLE